MDIVGCVRQEKSKRGGVDEKGEWFMGEDEKSGWGRWGIYMRHAATLNLRGASEKV
jgi:hypothetical protein